MDVSHLNCCNPGSESSGQEDTRHILVVVEPRLAHREEIKSVLMSLYHIAEFEESGPALDYIRTVQPGAVLISVDSPVANGLRLAHALRDSAPALPVMLILGDDTKSLQSAARASGASGWLVKPYLRSALIKLISGQLNEAIEGRWEELPVTQAKALKGTVEMFNSLSDVIDKGEPISYKNAASACSPLVEAVNSGSYKGILSGVRDHDNYTYAHSLRVAVFLSLFGKAIGLPEKDQRILATGGLLHDVGKMMIPHLVLNKPGRLSESEFAVMKGHVEASVKLLEAGDNIPKGVITIAGQHHEKLDGTGYPKGLKGTELNELARMASIVDVFSALTDRRVYKPPMDPETALGIMTDEMAGHLDLHLLSRFRQMLLDAVM